MKTKKRPATEVNNTDAPGKPPDADKKGVGERILYILESLHSRPHGVKVSELSNELNVSEVTIRGDIDWLTDIVGPTIVKYHGGARIDSAMIYPGGWYGENSRVCQHEKLQISSYAVDKLVNNGDYLLLDSGSQVEAFVRQLSYYPRTGIRAVSQAANFALLFLSFQDTEYVQLGGVLDTRAVLFADDNKRFATNAFFKHRTDEFLLTYCKNDKYKAIITASAFDSEKGAGATSQAAIDYKQKIINIAAEVIILIDHHKFLCRSRESVTQCGMRSDPWLETATKSATVVIDWPGDPPECPQELIKFTDRFRANEKRLDDKTARKYPNIRVFEVALYNDGILSHL